MDKELAKAAKATKNPFVKIDFIQLLNLAVEEVKEQQAIISFDAGRQAGQEEVVKWILKNGACPECGMGIEYKKWQAQLKAWGIEETK